MLRRLALCLLLIGVSVLSAQPVYIPASNPYAQSLTRSLISWWKLDELTGTRADAVGSNTLTDNNTVLQGGGVGSYALALDGTSQNLSVADPFAPPTAFTASAWIYPTTVAAGTRTVFQQGLTGSTNLSYQLFVSTATPTFIFSTDGSSAGVTATGPNVAANAWYLITVRWDGSNVTVYTNSTAGASQAYVATPFNSNRSLFVGSDETPSNFFSGRIQNLVIWNATDKGASIVTDLYNSGRGLRYEQFTAAQKVGLFDFWTLSEASGNRVGSYASTALAPTAAPGRLAGAVNSVKTSTGANFVLVNTESLSIASNSTLQTGDIDYSVACWFNVRALPTTAQYIISKRTGSGSAHEYGMWVRGSAAGSKVSFATGTGAAVLGIADSVLAPTIGEWNLAIGWHDAANSLTYIQLNNATPVSIADGGDPATAASPFAIGGTNAASTYMDGTQEECALAKRIWTAAERTYLYNSGAGRTYVAGGVR